MILFTLVKKFTLTVKSIFLFSAIILLASCSKAEEVKLTQNTTEESMPTLDVYKSPTCGCCEKWVKHIQNNGFQSRVHNDVNLFSFKQKKGIAPRYRSCHTAVSKEGYVFEGHVPAKFITRFLAESPKDALGLSVPAMPVGTPGMEVGKKFMPYKVLLLHTDGSSEIYSDINTYEEQF